MNRNRALEQLCDFPGCGKSYSGRMDCYRKVNPFNDSVYEVCQMFFQTCDSMSHYDYMATCMQIHWMEYHPDCIPGEWIDSLSESDPLGYLKNVKTMPFRFERFLKIVEERKKVKSG